LVTSSSWVRACAGEKTQPSLKSKEPFETAIAPSYMYSSLEATKPAQNVNRNSRNRSPSVGSTKATRREKPWNEGVESQYSHLGVRIIDIGQWDHAVIEVTPARTSLTGQSLVRA
jgi:hypothetical protein